MSNFFDDLSASLTTGKSYGMGESPAEFSKMIDTGSYAFNGLVSGSIYGGIQDNIVTGFAGESTTGKTYFTLGIVDQFLKTVPHSFIYLYDYETAIRDETLIKRNIDPLKIKRREPPSYTVEGVKNDLLQIVGKYQAAIADFKPKKNEAKPRIAFVLDSLGALPTIKEKTDSTEGSEKKDMTRSQAIRSLFRTVRYELAIAKIPFFIVNHVYANVGGYGPMQEINGGGGFKYACDTIITLMKTKDRDDKTKQITGNFIRATTYKSRLSKENQTVELLLKYDSGLDRFYGLLPIALKYGIFKKLGNKIEMPDNSKHFENAIIKNPEKFYTHDILERIEKAVQTEFTYGSFMEIINQHDEEESKD